jgi:hypothetical protein
MASSVEVKARWAYSELSSSRAGAVYRRYELDGLDRMAAQSVGFDQLGRAQRMRLANVLDAVRTQLAEMADMHHSYVLDAWSKGRLAQAFAVSHFNTPSRIGHLPFLDFLNRAPEAGPDGAPDGGDPRVVADRVTDSAMPEWGAIAVSDFPNLLIDGYLRAVLFMRHAPDSATLPVWVGLGTMGWRAQAQPMAGAAATQ